MLCYCHVLKTLPSTCINKFQKVTFRFKAITLTYDNIGTTIEEQIETEFEKRQTSYLDKNTRHIATGHVIFDTQPDVT